MKIPHSEGVANHTEPLSCVGHREVSGEAGDVGRAPPRLIARRIGYNGRMNRGRAAASASLMAYSVWCPRNAQPASRSDAAASPRPVTQEPAAF